MARSSGPAVHSTPVTVSSHTIVAQLDAQLDKSFYDYHRHSEQCKRCRNPVRSYQHQQDLCEIGRKFCLDITKLLYKKAEHVPNGVFEVSYKHGWEAVDGLIQIISHFNQGEYSRSIFDLKRFQPASTASSSPSSVPRTLPKAVVHPMIEDVPREFRGSGYDRDIAKSTRRSPQNNYSTTYGDPRQSWLDVGTQRAQGGSSPSGSSAGDKSVRFDSAVRVREFETHRNV